MRDRLGYALAITVSVVVLPYIITLCINGCASRQSSVLAKVSSGKDVVVTENGKNKLVDVERYIAMALPGLIDYKSDMELIEAQAVAVRGKILYEMGTDSTIKAGELEFTCYDRQDMIEKFGRTNYRRAQEVYEQAVYNTLGQTM